MKQYRLMVFWNGSDVEIFEGAGSFEAIKKQAERIYEIEGDHLTFAVEDLGDGKTGDATEIKKEELENESLELIRQATEALEREMNMTPDYPDFDVMVDTPAAAQDDNGDHYSEVHIRLHHTTDDTGGQHHRDLCIAKTECEVYTEASGEKHFVATGSSVKRPGDHPDPEIGLVLAYARALRLLSAKMESYANKRVFMNDKRSRQE